MKNFDVTPHVRALKDKSISAAHYGATVVRQNRQTLIKTVQKTTLLTLLIVVGAALFAEEQGLSSGPYLAVFLGAFAILLLVLQSRILNSADTWEPRLGTIGGWLLLVVAVLTGWALFIRVPPAPVELPYVEGSWFTRPWLFAIVYGGIVLEVARKLRQGDPYKVRIRAALVGIPFIAAWLVGSLAYGYVFWTGTVPYEYERSALKLDEAAAAIARHRLAWKEQYPGATVAVALSGGGYRAAGIHAGVLRALDELEIPIHYLTTVSGGSIIGAFYALGYAPNHFQSLLVAGKPALPNDLFNLYYLSTEWFCPTFRNSVTYSRYFRRTFFGRQTLGQTGNHHGPTLIVNATEFASGRRWALASSWEGHQAGCDSHPTSHKLDDLLVSDVVAASGAFPGAFEPMLLPDIPDHEFTDGGVSENLGLAGLREYFRRLPDTLPRPNVVIISDASKEAIATRPPRKWFMASMLARAGAVGTDAYARELYSDLTHDEYEEWLASLGSGQAPAHAQPFHSDQHRAFGFHSHDPNSAIGTTPVHTIILDPTSSYELADLVRQLGTGNAAATYEIAALDGTTTRLEVTADDLRAVPFISTLKELDVSEVAATGWLGGRIVEKYKQAISSALQEASPPAGGR